MFLIYITTYHIKRVSTIYINKIRLYIYDTYYPYTVTSHATLPPVGNLHCREKRTAYPSCMTYTVEKMGKRWISGPRVASSDIRHWEMSAFVAVTVRGKNIERWPTVQDKIRRQKVVIVRRWRGRYRGDSHQRTTTTTIMFKYLYFKKRVDPIYRER